MPRAHLKLSDQMRRLIDSSGLSRYQISQHTGIDHATLSRFMHGKGGMSIEGLDAVAECLGWRLVVDEQGSPQAKGASRAKKA